MQSMVAEVKVFTVLDGRVVAEKIYDEDTTDTVTKVDSEVNLRDVCVCVTYT